MTDSQIKALIQSEIHKTSQTNRFNVQSQGRHIHNDIDSPYVFQPIITYAGAIAHDGTVLLLPKGWSATTGSAGNYQVTHNLGASALFTVSAIPSADSGSGHDSISYSIGNTNPNLIDFFIFDTTLGVPSVCDFKFSITVVNNRSQKLPTYVGLLTQ